MRILPINSATRLLSVGVGLALLTGCLASSTPLLPASGYLVQARVTPGDYWNCAVAKVSSGGTTPKSCKASTITRDGMTYVLRTMDYPGDTTPDAQALQMFAPHGKDSGIIQSAKDGRILYSRVDFQPGGRFVTYEQRCNSIDKINDDSGLYQRQLSGGTTYCMFTDARALIRVVMDSNIWQSADGKSYMPAATQPWTALAQPPLFDPLHVTNSQVAYGRGAASQRIQILSIVRGVALGIEMVGQKPGHWAHVISWDSKTRTAFGSTKLIHIRALRPKISAYRFPIPSANVLSAGCGGSDSCGSLNDMIARHGPVGGEVLLQGTEIERFPSGRYAEGSKIVTVFGVPGDNAADDIRFFETDTQTGYTSWN